MNGIEDLLSNRLLIAAVLSWAAAQVIKTIINYGLTKSFNPERLIGSGGMPSSHSAFVSALCAAAGIHHGLASSEFAITFVLAFIVMYDAVGVRRETGRQAELLNEIMSVFQDYEGFPSAEERLKELVGHTPLQVLFGSLLGILIAFLSA
ncbi:MAG: divergent PAP2 family protein [Lachnospiraceae bacterium]|nr:divergent PAP2 family protein [Lachnospiraceae bacterium]